jgi:ABC-type bacteriocin/lantibiotic exporter with double-glycine peptidase domain
MKFQSKPYSCGSASIRNALLALGIRKNEKTIMKLANTNDRGTTEENIISAIQQLGFNPIKHEQQTFKRAWLWLHNRVRNGNPVILAVNNWGHWMIAFALLGNDRIVVFDSDKATSGKENGVLVWSKRQLKKKWFNANEKLYSGLAIER